MALGGEKTSLSDRQPLATCPSTPANHHHAPHTPAVAPSLSTTSTAPSCTCLADLYLTLANLSTIASLPLSPQKIESLQSATRTAHTVLYCPACPQSFQSSMQNVMLLVTLLTVIADGWSRILRAPAKTVARAFDTDLTTSLATDADLSASWTDAKESKWKLFGHYLIRQYVFGDTPPPGVHLPGICPLISAPTISSKYPPIILVNLCEAMERRQKSWHGLVEYTGEFVKPCHASDAIRRQEGNHSGSCGQGSGETSTGDEKPEHLCLKIVGSLRTVLAAVDTTDGKKKGCTRMNDILGR